MAANLNATKEARPLETPQICRKCGLIWQ